MRVWAALGEDLRSVLSIRLQQLTADCTSSSREEVNASGLHGCFGSHGRSPYLHTHTNINLKSVCSGLNQ